MARRGAGWTLGEQSGAGRGHRRKRAVKRLDVVDIPSPATRQMTWGWRAGPGQPSVEATRQEDVLRFEGPDFGIQRIHQRKCRIEGLDPLRRCAYARVQEPSARGSARGRPSLEEPSARGSARGRPSLEEPSARGSARGRPSLEELLCKVAPVLVWLPQRNPAQRIAAGETCLLHTQRRWCRQKITGGRQCLTLACAVSGAVLRGEGVPPSIAPQGASAVAMQLLAAVCFRPVNPPRS